MQETAPLILTLAFDEPSFAIFEQQRRRYFPPQLNVVPAHLTLFHHLPGEQLSSIQQTIEAACSDRWSFDLDVTGLRSLGRGVAYVLKSPELSEMRKRLALHWNDWLTPQDRQNHNPHVTVQNKVNPTQARALLEDLTESFRPFQVAGIGLDLWRYRQGPWEKVRSFLFQR